MAISCSKCNTSFPGKKLEPQSLTLGRCISSSVGNITYPGNETECVMLVLVLQEVDSKTGINRQRCPQGKCLWGKGLEKLHILRPDVSLRREASPPHTQRGCRESWSYQKIPRSSRCGPDFVSLPHWAPGWEQCGLSTNPKYGGGFWSLGFAPHSWGSDRSITVATRPRIWPPRGSRLDCFQSCIPLVIG